MCGWCILNIQEFNKALPGKLWWKIYSIQNNCWSKIIHFNYLNREPLGPLFHTPSKNKSFFWVGITSIVSPFRSCSSKIVRNSATMLLWYDNWLEGRALKDLWPDLFNDCILPCISIRQFTQDFPSPKMIFRTTSLPKISPLLSSVPNCSSIQDDVKTWTSESNRIFFVLSFYKFMVDGGIRSPLYHNFGKLTARVK